jgi:hypothetical protein
VYAALALLLIPTATMEGSVLYVDANTQLPLLFGAGARAHRGIRCVSNALCAVVYRKFLRLNRQLPQRILTDARRVSMRRHPAASDAT